MAAAEQNVLRRLLGFQYYKLNISIHRGFSPKGDNNKHKWLSQARKKIHLICSINY